MRRSSFIATGITLLLVSAFDSHVSGHRRDEYPQATRLGIGPAEIELHLDLTPGIELASAFIGAIDRNADGWLSNDERAVYAEGVVQHLEVEVDGRRVQLTSPTFEFPELEAVRRGVGTIQLRSKASLTSLSGGAHQLVFRNLNRPTESAYLANLLVPASDQVLITSQRRDPNQRELVVDYFVNAHRAASVRAWMLIGIAAFVVFVVVRVQPSRKIEVDPNSLRADDSRRAGHLRSCDQAEHQ